jgi:hypothetical protein
MCVFIEYNYLIIITIKMSLAIENLPSKLGASRAASVF